MSYTQSNNQSKSNSKINLARSENSTNMRREYVRNKVTYFNFFNSDNFILYFTLFYINIYEQRIYPTS